MQAQKRRGHRELHEDMEGKGEGGEGLWAHPPVRDVRGAHHGGNVDHRVPHHAGAVGLGVLTNQVAGQEAAMGTTQQGHSARIKVFLLEHLLDCKLQGGADHAAASGLLG